jgi:hypothetical protein
MVCDYEIPKQVIGYGASPRTEWSPEVYLSKVGIK